MGYIHLGCSVEFTLVHDIQVGQNHYKFGSETDFTSKQSQIVKKSLEELSWLTG